MSKPEPILFLSDARGIYIPQHFAESIKPECLSGVSAEDMECLKLGPDQEWYWEAWSAVCDHAVITDSAGQTFSVYQDGDCWLIPAGMEWNDKLDWYEWPSEETEDESEEDSTNVQ